MENNDLESRKMVKRKLTAIIITVCMLCSVPFSMTEIKAANVTMEVDKTTPQDAVGNVSEDSVIIHAEDYQPDTEHGNGWTLAIGQMIEDTKEYSEPVTISFPKGTYHIYPDQIEGRELYISNTVGTDQNNKKKKIGFLFENMENITVEGNGSLFYFMVK